MAEQKPCPFENYNCMCQFCEKQCNNGLNCSDCNYSGEIKHSVYIAQALEAIWMRISKTGRKEWQTMAKRLIDADALFSELVERQYSDETMGIMHSQYPHFQAIVGRQPTVDAVEVVRCRDCEWFDKGSLFKHSRCKHLSGMTFPSANDFCSCGKRKKGEYEDGEQGEKDEQGRESVLDSLRHPDGRPDIRYDGIVSGAFAKTMCKGCPKAVYGGACPTPAFPPEDGGQEPEEDV